MLPESILANAQSVEDVLAGHAAALAYAEAANAKHKTAIEESSHLLGQYQLAVSHAEEAGRRATEAVEALQAWGQAVECLAEARRFLDVLESN